MIALVPCRACGTVPDLDEDVQLLQGGLRLKCPTCGAVGEFHEGSGDLSTDIVRAHVIKKWNERHDGYAPSG